MRDKDDTSKGRSLTVLNLIGNHAQGQRLNVGDRLGLGDTVSHAPGNRYHVGNPAAVNFDFCLDHEFHSFSIRPNSGS